MVAQLLFAAVAGLFSLYNTATANSTKPNIIMVMSDDQDYRLGSFDTQEVVQQRIVSEGVILTNHFVTAAQCCPSRVSLHRGQAAHNTNNTHVKPAGGGYAKFLQSGEDDDYLPHWLKKAGYHTEYIGKLFNGINLANYSPQPKGWDHVDVLVDPYTYAFNNVVMSTNGERPVFYRGYHQTDVIRAKALARLEHLASQGDPFYLSIAPASPHVQGGRPPVPLARHMNDFSNATVPRSPNFNPEDNFQQQKGSWLQNLTLMSQDQKDYADRHYQCRLQALKGLDEIVQDVLDLLNDKKMLNNTYVIYTTDNGYHLGNHRVPAGKSLPYIEDTNVPMAVRGPGIPHGKVSKIPSTHIDMAPTFLEMAGLASKDYPVFLDGRSLLKEWQSTSDDEVPDNLSYTAREIINVEFWGSAGIEDPTKKKRFDNNSYKTLRIVGEESAWLFTRWCTGNQTELYNTIDDPYELTNLAIRPTPEHTRLITRLNGLLLVTKSCSKSTCRNPWLALQPNQTGATISSLDDAMLPQYDAFFSSLPHIGFQECMHYQYIPNEVPFYLSEVPDLGRKDHQPTDNFEALYATGYNNTPGNDRKEGTWAQRNVTLATIMESARNLTDGELGEAVWCSYPNYCGHGDSAAGDD